MMEFIIFMIEVIFKGFVGPLIFFVVVAPTCGFICDEISSYFKRDE